MTGTEELLSAFDVDNIATEALLFQTGYLTIAGEEELGGRSLYRLGYPNREVRQSLNEYLLRHLVQVADRQDGQRQWYTNNDIADYEGFYASVFCSYFAALGYDLTVEDSSSHGRLDMALRTGGHVYRSSSRSWRWRRPDRRWRSCRSAATPPSTAPAVSRSGWEATDPARGKPVSARGSRST